MKKIAIVSLGYFWTPVESGPTRFFDIAKTFCNSGYDVEVITTDFQHFDKKPRNKEKISAENYPFKITFIPTPEYKKNVDIRRVLSNISAAKNVKKYLSEHIKEYDAVYCSIPANNVAAEVSKICKENLVPCVIDIEDLWPEAMAMIVKNKFIGNVIFHSFYRDAEIAYKNASGIIGTSEDYADRAFKNQNLNIPKDTIYVGCNLDDFDSGVSKFSDEIHKPENEFWLTYAGSISTSYDIKTLILAAEQLIKQGHKDIKIKILGTGSLKEELENLTKENNIENVQFCGFTPYQKMAAFLSKSDIVINSFVKGAPQSIVNKVGDYLASGKAMINTLENPVFCKLVDKYKVGVNIEPENIDILSKTILRLKENNSERTEMGTNARHLAETEFDRKVSYLRIVDMIEKVQKNQV